jgi:hypothetical protein
MGGAGGLEGKGSGLGLGTVWRVYIKHSCCDLCCINNVLLEVVRWWFNEGRSLGAVAWIYGDCLGEWMRKKMKSKTRCSWLLCCSVALLLLLPCTVNKYRNHAAACRNDYDGGVVVSGLRKIDPQPGNINMMWHHILTTTMPVHTT